MGAELVDLDAVMMGRSDGRFSGQLALIADGEAVAAAPAGLFASPERFGSATPNSLMGRLGGLEAQAADHGPASRTGVRLTRARELRIVARTASGAEVHAFSFRPGAWAELMAARVEVQKALAADQAAGRCAAA